MSIPQFLLDNAEAIINYNQGPFDLMGQYNKAAKLTSDDSELQTAMGVFDSLMQAVPNHLITRTDVSNLIQSGSLTVKQEILLIVSWGIFFSAVPNNKTRRLFLRHISSADDEGLSFYKQLVANINEAHSSYRYEKIERAFLQLNSSRRHKIPGIAYPYFTKIFYFYSRNNMLPILDQWTTKAFIYLLMNSSNINKGEINELKNMIFHENAFKEGNEEFRIRKGARRQAYFYNKYVDYMENWANGLGVSITNLESYIFGNSLLNDQTINNPRVIYNNFFSELFTST